ncbi:transmembrane channel-like protein 4 isoform X1 [Malaclemys terrapin pileata]|uniref:transmembrane channel-like protein 4 isoform X1 n=1 Tax=Malaclemys terrapin pileata TaxID=2991368 RepID=UPI0023A8D813|nr:transmembrane channel-like protein 4 isoform X1 [Malaclemys terrapin pileata]
MEPRWVQTGRDGPDDEGGQQLPPSSLFLQLPSNATLRFRGNVAKSWGAAMDEGEPPGTPQERERAEVGEQESVPLKQLPLCMAEKRTLRLREQQAAWKRSRWERWQVGMRRLRGQVGDALLYAQVWRGSLHHIEGHFGTGIQSYFNFLRFLVLLNLGGALLVMGFVVAPNAAFEGLRLNQTQQGPNSTVISCLQYDPTTRGLVSYFTYLMDLLSGTGFMELTYLFYGYYQNSAVDFVGFSYNIPLAYLLSMLGYFSVCLLWIVHRAVHLLKRSLVSENGALSTYSNKVFAGWDFCLGPGAAVHIKHSSLRYELRMDLEEQTLRRLMAQRSPGQRLALYGLRGALNLLVVALLGAAFYCVYLATEYSQKGQQDTGSGQQGLVLGLLVAYLPSIVITFANQLVPLAFGLLVRLERYPLSLEIRLTLFRTVFLRLSSLLVLLFSLWSQITCHGDPNADSCKTCGYNYTQHPCWETSVGQEMYKLLVFDLLVVLLVLLLVEFPRKLLVTHGPAPLARLWGQQEFLVPPNVLDLVYGQTVCWVGAAFSPLLPLLNTAKFVLLFYLKKLTLFSNCRPADRTFRASSASFFFLLVLLLGLAIAWVPLLYSVFVLQPSHACGPFRGEPTMWSTLWEAIDTLPHVAREFLQFVGSLAFAVPLFLLLCILMFYLMALAHSYSSLVKELKGQLRLEGRDKVFLVTQITELS